MKLLKFEIFTPFWNSFLGNLVKATLFVFALLIVIFQIKPKQAYVFSDIGSFGEAEIQAGLIQCKDSTNLTLSGSNPIRINLEECDVNGVSYSSSDWLVFRFDKSEAIIPTAIIRGKVKYAFLQDVLTTTGSSPSLNLGSSASVYHTRFAEIYFSGEQEITYPVDRGFAYIENSDGTILCELNDGNTLTLSCNNRKPTLQDFRIMMEAGQSDDSTEAESNDFIIGVSPKEVYISSISKFSSEITGNISISYTATAQEYELKRQELKVENNNSPHPSLTFEYDYEEEKGCLWGYVSDGSISTSSVFPTFLSWFYSSALIAPVTIITTVFSAIALFNKKKEKMEKFDGEKKEETKTENEERGT